MVLEAGKLIEDGSVRDVLTTPKQAYTKALINALPQREPDREPVPADAPLIAANDVAVSFPGSGGAVLLRGRQARRQWRVAGRQPRRDRRRGRRLRLGQDHARAAP